MRELHSIVDALKELDNKPFIFSLVNFLSLPIGSLLILLLPTIFLPGDQGGWEGVGWAIMMGQYAMVALPLYLLGWGLWVYSRISNAPFTKNVKRINYLILAIPFTIVAFFFLKSGIQSIYANMQRSQLTHDKSAEYYNLNDTKEIDHRYRLISLFPSKKLAVAGKNRAAKDIFNNDTLNKAPLTCLRTKSWFHVHNEYEYSTGRRWLHDSNLKVLRMTEGKFQTTDLKLSDLDAFKNSNGCIEQQYGQQKPFIAHISEYASDENNFVAIQDGSGRKQPILKGFKSSNNNILTDIYADDNGRNWYVMTPRTQKNVLYAGYAKENGEEKLYQLNLPGNSLIDYNFNLLDIQDLKFTNNEVWILGEKKVFGFKL